MADMQLVDYLRLENYEAGGKYLCSLTPEEGARQTCALKNLKDQTVALRMLLGEKGGSRVFYALPEEKRCELADTISDNEHSSSTMSRASILSMNGSSAMPMPWLRQSS